MLGTHKAVVIDMRPRAELTHEAISDTMMRGSVGSRSHATHL